MLYVEEYKRLHSFMNSYFHLSNRKYSTESSKKYNNLVLFLLFVIVMLPDIRDCRIISIIAKRIRQINIKCDYAVS